MLAGALAATGAPADCREAPQAAMTVAAPRPAAVIAAVMASFATLRRIMIVFSYRLF